jgi:hypothetical protein
MFKGKYGVVLGVVCVLYSYGAVLLLNFHVYVLFTEGGLTRGWCVGLCFFFGVWCFEVYLAVSVVDVG